MQIDHPDSGCKNFLDVALDYAALGFSVFPCRFRTKQPATRRGFYDATTNPATIRRWFGGAQPYNIAIRTGIASGVWILDVDDVASLQVLEGRHGPLPETRQSQSSRGLHFWWRANSPVQGSASRVAPHVDVRGEDGYIIAPPSVHPDGPIYRWLSIGGLATAPGWLVELTRKPAPAPIKLPPRTHNGPPGAYGAAALEREIDELAAAPRGCRNHALNKASFCLHQLVAGGELDGADVERELLAAAATNGLLADPQDGPASVLRTIRSGARAGLQNPRSRS
jgi:hypothetical protein